MADIIPLDQVYDDTAIQQAAPGLPSFIPHTQVVDDLTPSIWQHPMDALTSSDWWHSRPDGTPVSNEQAIVGPMMGALNGLTLNSGDEITAGGSALIDALKGGNLSDSYDQRLQEARGIQNDTPLAAKVITGLAGGLKMPVPDIMSKAEGVAPALGNIAKGAGLGTIYGGVGGFMEGEGGFDNRAKSLTTGAKYGTAGGVLFSTLGEGMQKIGNSFKESAPNLLRGSIGAKYGNYKSTANDLGMIDLPDGDLTTLTSKAVDDVLANPKITSGNTPGKMLKNLNGAAEDLSTNINGVVSGYKNPVKPSFDNALQYLSEGKVPADKIDSYLERLGKLESNINSEGKGSLSYLQQQKIAQGRLYDPNDTTLNGFNRAIYHDLQNTIEGAVPEVTALNEELQKLKLVKPILENGVAMDNASNPLKTIIQGGRTSGGFGTLGLALGSAIGGIPGAVIGTAGSAYLGGKLSSPSGQRLIASLANSGGSSLSKLGTKSINAIPAILGAFPPESNEHNQSQNTKSQISSIVAPRSTMTSAAQKQSPTTQEMQSKTVVPSSNSSPTPAPSQVKKETVTPQLYHPASVQGLIAQQHPLVQAVIQIESGGNPNAVSPTGVKGLMQLTSATAKDMGVTDRTDPQQSVEGGTKYLSQMLQKYKDPQLALAAYNGGPGTVDRAVNAAIKQGLSPTWANVRRFITSTETKNYPGKVLGAYSQITKV